MHFGIVAEIHLILLKEVNLLVFATLKIEALLKLPNYS